MFSWFFGISLFFLVSTAFCQGAPAASTQPNFKLAGGATLTSNFVEKGLTQTKSDPGMQADFWFNFGSQFRMGLWGSNVSYDSASSTHFWLKLNADVKVDFSPQTNMVIKYSENKYFRANRRDGNTVGLHFDFSGYKILYEMDSNWQGTRAKSTYAGMGKDSLAGDWIWTNQGGYTMPVADGVKGFFDVRTSLGKKMKDIFCSGGLSYSTAAGSFKDQGELAIILSASVKY